MSPRAKEINADLLEALKRLEDRAADLCNRIDCGGNDNLLSSGVAFTRDALSAARDAIAKAQPVSSAPTPRGKKNGT